MGSRLKKESSADKEKEYEKRTVELKIAGEEIFVREAGGRIHPNFFFNFVS